MKKAAVVIGFVLISALNVAAQGWDKELTITEMTPVAIVFGGHSFGCQLGFGHVKEWKVGDTCRVNCEWQRTDGYARIWNHRTGTWVKAQRIKNAQDIAKERVDAEHQAELMRQRQAEVARQQQQAYVQGLEEQNRKLSQLAGLLLEKQQDLEAMNRRYVRAMNALAVASGADYAARRAEAERLGDQVTRLQTEIVGMRRDMDDNPRVLVRPMVAVPVRR